MTQGVSRNDPCPCGSGKKYKACCLVRPAQQGSPRPHSGRFRFEPGSYGGPGIYVPSIACLKEVRPDQWQYHFVLVRPRQVLADEDAASAQARQDLVFAFGQGEQAASERVAEALKSLGYVSVDDFRVVQNSPSGSGTEP